MKKTLAPEALYSSGNFYTVNHLHGGFNGDYIPGFSEATRRMQELDPNGDRAKALLFETRAEFNPAQPQ